MGYLNELLIDRENPYAIDVELEIRKIFEWETDYTYEFQKNEDPYDYDISVFKYYINGADWKKKLIAYIELEVSESWKDEYPYWWKTYSFLKRKVYKWDYNDNNFTNELKDNVDKTIYIIFNKKLSDSCCSDIKTISTFKEEVLSNGGKTGDLRKDTYLREPLNTKRVIRGTKNCVERIKDFIKQKE